MRITKTKYYILETTPGLSGFQQWNKVERFIVTGYKAKNEKTHIVDVFNPAFMAGDITCKLEDGHVRDCQPTVSLREALNWLDDNKFQRVYIGTYTN